jgi:hypothetical protein
MVALGCKQTPVFPVQALFSIPSCIPHSIAHVNLHTLFNALTNTTHQARPATTSFSKRSHQQQQREVSSYHQISRVPPLPLFEGGGSSSGLELHSSPVHLATRSLSARTLLHTSAATGTPSVGGSGLRSSSTVSLPSSLKRSSLGAQQINAADKSEQKRQSERGHSAAKRKVKRSVACCNMYGYRHLA